MNLGFDLGYLGLGLALALLAGWIIGVVENQRRP